jgi:hypothetical protein
MNVRTQRAEASKQSTSTTQAGTSQFFLGRHKFFYTVSYTFEHPTYCDKHTVPVTLYAMTTYCHADPQPSCPQRRTTMSHNQRMYYQISMLRAFLN